MRKKLSTRISAVLASATMVLAMQASGAAAYSDQATRQAPGFDPVVTDEKEPIGEIEQNGIIYDIYEGNEAHVKYGCYASGTVQIPYAIYANNTHYVVKEIDNYAFLANEGVTAIDMQYASGITRIGALAFAECKNLETVALPFNVNISMTFATAFNGCDSFRAFMPTYGANYNVIDGVLYDKDLTKIIKYPSAKPDVSLTIGDENVTIGMGAFSNVKYIKNINVPYEFTSSTADYIINKYFAVFYQNPNNVTVNGISMFEFSDDDSEEPRIVPGFEETVTENMECANYYAKRYAAYVVKQIINDEDSDFAKAVKLHNWLCSRVEYDPVVSDKLAEGDFYYSDIKDHCDASAFLHYEEAHDSYTHAGYYTVCDGYARAYKLLMNAAGMVCERVTGVPAKNGISGHVWNIIKVDGKYYYVDTTGGLPGDYQEFMSFTETIGNAAASNYVNWRLETRDDIDHLPYETEIMEKIGDADGNGYLSVDDYKKIKEFISAGVYDVKADVNADSEVNEDDADIMAKYILLNHGDVNADGIIDQNDIDKQENTIKFSLEGNVINSDINLDGVVDTEDLKIIKTMSGTKTHSVNCVDFALIDDIAYGTSPEFNIGDIDGDGGYGYADAQMLYNIADTEAEGGELSYTEEQRW